MKDLRPRSRTKPKSRPTDAEMLAFFRSLEAAKPLRAGMMHYVIARERHGAGVAITDDAELNVYRKACALFVEAKKKIVKRKKDEA